MIDSDTSSSNTTVEAEATVTSGSLRQRRRQAVGAIANQCNDGRFSNGDLAQLRRLDLRRGHAATDSAFWHIVARDLDPRGLFDDNDPLALRRWMAVLQGLATIHGQHRNKVRLGTALAQAEISEARFIRLLRAQGDALLALIRPLAHQLRSSGHPVDWADVADFVFSDGTGYADDVRRGLAVDFYRQQIKQDPQQKDTQGTPGA